MKMFKYIYPAIPLLFFLLISGCCNCSKSIDDKNYVRGTITVVGNSPFVNLAIRTDDNNIYVLQTSKELKEELWKKQGAYYFVKFEDILEEDGLTKLIVEKVIPLVKEAK